MTVTYRPFNKKATKFDKLRSEWIDSSRVSICQAVRRVSLEGVSGQARDNACARKRLNR